MFSYFFFAWRSKSNFQAGRTVNPFPYYETTPFGRRNNQRVDDQVVDFRKSRMWEKSRGIPLGPERVEAKPLENRSECSRVLSPSLFLPRFLKGP